MLVSPPDLVKSERGRSTLCASPWEMEKISFVESQEILSAMAMAAFNIVYVGVEKQWSIACISGICLIKEFMRRNLSACCIIFLDICKVPPVKIHISPQTHQVAGVLSERSIRSHLCMRVWVQWGDEGAVIVLCWLSSLRSRIMMWLCWVLWTSV